MSANDFVNREKEIIIKLENELVKAKLKYESKDPDLFQDIEEVIAGLRVSSSYSEEEKLRYYDFVFQLITDINNNLYSNKKIIDRDFRRAIRLFPSIFYYSHEKLLTEFILQNSTECMNIMSYLQADPEIKENLIQLGVNFPKLFYNQVDELFVIQDFSSIIHQLASKDPGNWVEQLDKNTYLADLSTQSSSPYIKKVIDIKRRLGSQSSLFNYLDEIIKNSFNDSREIEFSYNQSHLTKKLIQAAIDETAYGSVTSANYLIEHGQWIFKNYIDEGSGVFSLFTNNELFGLLVLSHHYFENQDLKDIIQYINNTKDDLVRLNTLKALPNNQLKSFLKKIHQSNLMREMNLTLELDGVSYLASKNQNFNEKLPLKDKEWFDKNYSYEKEKKSTQIANQVSNTPIGFQLNKSQLALLNWTRNINKVDSNILSILKSTIGHQFTDFLAENHPQILLNNRKKIKQIPEFGSIINRVAYHSPNTIKKYMSSDDNEATQHIKTSNDPIAQLINSIYNKYQFNSKAYTLIHKIANKELSIEDAHRVSQNKVLFLKHLMNITTQKKPIGLHSVEEEQNQISLKYIREINDNPSNAHPNLQEIRTFNSKEIYSLMVLGKEEIFQFAFDNCFKVLLDQLGTTSIIDFLPSVNYYQYREFASLLANFNKFPELLFRNTSPESRTIFLEKMATIDFTNINCIEQAAILCEFINNCDHTEIQTIIQNKIFSEYKLVESKKNQMAMAVYSLLASNIGSRALVHQEWYESMKKKYAKYTLSHIDVEGLKNDMNRIIEVSYFYNDADGVASFNSYINTFRSMPKWYVQDLGSYFYISSLEGNDYDIFANNPNNEQAGQQAMRDYLVFNGLEPAIVVHRGHSYHSQKTIDQLIGSPKFIFMGSCGGYYKIPELLVRSPNAQILSTKQVGTMNINDPMLRTIHELIRTNQNLDWPNFWSGQEQKLRGNKDFKMYVPPHKNNGALFINAFFKVVGN